MKSPSNNMTLFNENVAFVLSYLYATFPITRDIDSRNLLKKKRLNNIDDIISYSTVEWLDTNGFITMKDRNERDFKDVTLSHKGLELLKQTPDSIKDKTTLGERIAALIHGGAKESAAELISIGLSKMIG